MFILYFIVKIIIKKRYHEMKSELFGYYIYANDLLFKFIFQFFNYKEVILYRLLKYVAIIN